MVLSCTMVSVSTAYSLACTHRVCYGRHRYPSLSEGSGIAWLPLEFPSSCPSVERYAPRDLAMSKVLSKAERRHKWMDAEDTKRREEHEARRKAIHDEDFKEACTKPLDLVNTGLAGDVSFLKELGILPCCLPGPTPYFDNVFYNLLSMFDGGPDLSYIPKALVRHPLTVPRDLDLPPPVDYTMRVSLPTADSPSTLPLHPIPCHPLRLRPTSHQATGDFQHAFRVFDTHSICSLHGRPSNGDKEDLFTLVFDTGCSVALTFCESDFVELHPMKGSISTANGSSPITGYGLVRWKLITELGELVDVNVPAQLCPDSLQRLLSPQAYCQYHNLGGDVDHFGGNGFYWWLTVVDDRDKFHRFRCPIHPGSNLPVGLGRLPDSTACKCSTSDDALPSGEHTSQHCAQHCHLSVADEVNQNLTAAQKEVLLWHQRLGHTGFHRVQSLFSQPAPPHVFGRKANKKSKSWSISKAKPSPFEGPSSKDLGCCIDPKHATARTCPPPMCAACQLAKQHRRGVDSFTAKRNHEAVLSEEKLKPGDRVSVDHYESSVRGRLPHTRGRESTGQKYTGGTICADHASRVVWAYHQPT